MGLSKIVTVLLLLCNGEYFKIASNIESLVIRLSVSLRY